MDITGLIGNVGASSAGSILSKLATFPLDTLSVQAQTSTKRALFSVPLRSYYRGIGVALILTTPATGVYLTTREAAQISLLPHLGDGPANDALSGIIAELAGSSLFTPMEVLKARLQISRSGQEGKLMYQVRDLIAKEGFRGFYRGWLMGLASYIPYNILWWTTYGKITRDMSDSSKFAKITCGAGAASLLSATFIHPLELVKTRYQVATSETVAAAGTLEVSRRSDKDGFRQVARNVMKESGLKGFYAGFLPAVLRAAPGSIITMIVFENLKARRRNDDV